MSNLTSEVKVHFGQKLRIWLKDFAEKKLSWYLSYFPSYGHLKFSIWPQRSNLTLEVKVQLGQKLRIWIKDFAEKKLSLYLLQYISYGHLKFSVWPQRSILTLEVKVISDKSCIFDQRTLQKKNFQICAMASELWMFESFYLASEVKVHFSQKLCI